MDAITSKAASAYAAALNRATSSSGSPSPADNKAGGFANMLGDLMSSVSSTGKAAESASLSAAVKQAEMVDIVATVTNAELTLEAVVTVRDQVIQAYNDIIKMPI